MQNVTTREPRVPLLSAEPSYPAEDTLVVLEVAAELGLVRNVEHDSIFPRILEIIVAR